MRLRGSVETSAILLRTLGAFTPAIDGHDPYVLNLASQLHYRWCS